MGGGELPVVGEPEVGRSESAKSGNDDDGDSLSGESLGDERDAVPPGVGVAVPETADGDGVSAERGPRTLPEAETR